MEVQLLSLSVNVQHFVISILFFFQFSLSLQCLWRVMFRALSPSKLECFAKILSYFQLLTIFVKHSILDVLTRFRIHICLQMHWPIFFPFSYLIVAVDTVDQHRISFLMTCIYLRLKKITTFLVVLEMGHLKRKTVFDLKTVPQSHRKGLFVD